MDCVTIRHAGDLGNVIANAGGEADGQILDGQIKLCVSLIVVFITYMIYVVVVVIIVVTIIALGSTQSSSCPERAAKSCRLRLGMLGLTSHVERSS